MRITNFRDYVVDNTDRFYPVYFAKVDVTTGFLWWKRTETVVVSKANVHWFFVDTGKWTNGWKVEELHKAYVARKTYEGLA